MGKVVLCNAVTGDMKTYDIEDVPEWVDRAYSADLLVQLFDYYGTLKHGFFNSILSQKDCLKTTDGYNYLALDDDVWMYTDDGDKVLQGRGRDGGFRHVFCRGPGAELEV